jgi:hypothetical protein
MISSGWGLRAAEYIIRSGKCYVAHPPNGKDLYLVMPIREWDGK